MALKRGKADQYYEVLQKASKNYLFQTETPTGLNRKEMDVFTQGHSKAVARAVSEAARADLIAELEDSLAQLPETISTGSVEILRNILGIQKVLLKTENDYD